MKKIFLFGLLLFLFLISSRVFAGSELEDYQFQLEKYRQNYVSFSTARNKFLKYETLESRKEATEATQEILLLRTRALKTYFSFLDARLRITPGIDKAEKEKFANLLQVKTSWLADHETVLNSLSRPTLEKLFSLSDEVEGKAFEMKRLARQVEGLIYLGKVKELGEECRDFDKRLKEEEGADLPVMQEWFAQVEKKFEELSEEILKAEEEWQLLDDKKKVDDERDLNRTFLRFKNHLIKAQEILGEIIAFQIEINLTLKSPGEF